MKFTILVINCVFLASNAFPVEVVVDEIDLIKPMIFQVNATENDPLLDDVFKNMINEGHVVKSRVSG